MYAFLSYMLGKPSTSISIPVLILLQTLMNDLTDGHELGTPSILMSSKSQTLSELYLLNSRISPYDSPVPSNSTYFPDSKAPVLCQLLHC